MRESYSCVGMRGGVLTHVEVRGQPHVPFFKRHVSFETWSLTGAWGLPIRLGNPISDPWGSAYLCITNTFHRDSEDKIQTLILIQQAFYKLIYHYLSLFLIFRHYFNCLAQ